VNNVVGKGNIISFGNNNVFGGVYCTAKQNTNIALIIISNVG